MSTDTALIIAGCAGVTVSARALPLIFLSGIELPAILRNWLSFVPMAIMTAIVAADLLGRWHANLVSGEIAVTAAAAAVVIGILTRSLFATVCAGVLFYLALHSLPI